MRKALADALNHLYVLLPVLDDAKHYWVSIEEVDKLIRAGGDWQPPARDRGQRRRSRRLNKSQAIVVNANRTAVTVALPKAQLEPAVLNVSQSYVYAQQQGLFNRIG